MEFVIKIRDTNENITTLSVEFESMRKVEDYISVVTSKGGCISGFLCEDNGEEMRFDEKIAACSVSTKFITHVTIFKR